MKLYIIRHALAIERGGGVADEDRYLTPRGRELFRVNAQAFAKKGCLVDYIITSPLVRCVQTADILAEAINFSGELVTSRDVAPGFDVSKLYRIIGTARGAQRIAVVGHEPDLGNIIESLLKSGESWSLKKGMIVSLDMIFNQHEMPARLNWILHKGKKKT